MDADKALPYFKYVFVVLVYRVAEDLYDFANSLHRNIDEYKVIIVNSFLNKESESRIKEIATELDCDFFTIKNKGYGYGNNRGVEYAKNHYNYEYLIISNADVVIEKFDINGLPSSNAVVGPKLITIKGKHQNPYWAIENKPMEKLIYTGLSKKFRLNMVIAQGINKTIREVFLKFTKNVSTAYKVYAVHGAFIIFTKDVVERIYPIYDENMFLYYEEAYLANRLKQMGVGRFYYPQICIRHKEDGSTKGLNTDLSCHAVDSFVYYYDNYVIGRNNNG